MDCQDIVIHLTEYSRGQLPFKEFTEVKTHLETCNNCKKENTNLQELSKMLDKIIPSVNTYFEKKIILDIFVRAEKESIFTKSILVFLIASFFILLFSYFIDYKSYKYPTLKDLQKTSQNLFE